MLLLGLTFSTTSFGQKLVDFEYESTIEIGVINFISTAIRPQFDVDLYKVTYLTNNARGEEHVASGLVCIPDDDNLTFPLACHQHGTVAGREDVPSRLAGGFQLPLAFASRGYVVAAPDFVGLGDSEGTHPYVHADTEASAGVDLLLAVREMAEQLDGLSLNDQLFIAGYSQGGHAAMALQREIELNQADDFIITASAPMSGPYDVSGAMVDFTLGDEEYMTVAYLAWLTLGYQEAYPDELAGFTLETVFQPEYLDDIRAFANEEIDLWTLNDALIATLQSTVGAVIPKNILNPEIVDALFNEPTHPFSVALADNDLINWTPMVPTRMYYCMGDEQVTFQNAIIAEETMRANGAPDVTAVRMDTDARLLTHGGCVIPASIDGIDWFDTFKEVTSSTDNIDLSGKINVYAAENILSVNTTEVLANMTVQVYDLSGRPMLSYNVSNTENSYDIADLNSGFYLVNINSGQSIKHVSKFVKH